MARRDAVRGVQVSISLILTFMLLWDWPNIKRGVTSLRDSRLGGFYEEVAPSLIVFAQLFGKALQAQTRIAIVNTVLTFAGMWLLGIPGLLLLSLFVFMCRCAAPVTLLPCTSIAAPRHVAPHRTPFQQPLPCGSSRHTQLRCEGRLLLCCRRSAFAHLSDRCVLLPEVVFACASGSITLLTTPAEPWAGNFFL